MPAGKSSVVADMVAQAGQSEGRAGGHTPAAAGEGDLFLEAQAFGDELALFEGHGVRPPKRGPGRPVGSLSRTTLQLNRLMAARGYRDPAEFLASLISMDTRTLAGELRPDDLEPTFDQAHEALKLQVRAAEALMPFFHQKKPIAVEHSGDGQRPVIIINDAGIRTEARTIAAGATMSAHEPQQYQGLSQGEAVASDEAASASDG